MQKFVASRISEGNHLFPASITILDDGIKVKIPNFWRDQETYFNFQDITGISIDNPSWYSVLTYSTISFNARGTWVKAHGFSTNDGNKIKRLIEEGQKGMSKNNSNSSHRGSWNNRENYEHDQEVKRLRNEEKNNKRQLYLTSIPKYQKNIAKLFAELIEENQDNFMKEYTEIKSDLKTKIDKKLSDLKTVLEFVYEEIWEVEYDTIMESMREDVKKYRKEIQEKRYKDYSRENKKKALETSKKINIEKKKQIKLIIRYSSALDRDDILEYNYLNGNVSLIIDSFLNSIHSVEDRDKQTRTLLSSDTGSYYDDTFIMQLYRLSLLIHLIYDSILYAETDKNGEKLFPFGLDNKKERIYLSNSAVNVKERISKIIDFTDDFIERISTYL